MPAGLRAVKRLGYVQIDTISVVERAHHHTLWSRVPNYQTRHLQRLLAKRQLFEYWSHAAAYLPMEDYRFCIPMMRRLRQVDRHWYERDPKICSYVLERIRAEGPLMSRDFEQNHSAKGMWDLKPAKRAIHELFMQGLIMVSERRGFQKVFDLAERIVPSWVCVSCPSRQEMVDHIIESTLKAHGLVAMTDFAYQRKHWQQDIAKRVADWIRDGRLVEIEVRGRTYITDHDFEERIPAVVRRSRVIPISPFDNSVIQRRRLQRLFDFDYQTEIYLPKHKRRYGYFSMPLLWGDRFIGRLDPKAHRREGCLEIKNLQMDPWMKPSTGLIEALATGLTEFARFNACHQLEWSVDTAICREVASRCE